MYWKRYFIKIGRHEFVFILPLPGWKLHAPSIFSVYVNWLEATRNKNMSVRTSKISFAHLCMQSKRKRSVSRIFCFPRRGEVAWLIKVHLPFRICLFGQRFNTQFRKLVHVHRLYVASPDTHVLACDKKCCFPSLLKWLLIHSTCVLLSGPRTYDKQLPVFFHSNTDDAFCFFSGDTAREPP